MKAMILAAGRGERLRPRTDRTPKALIEAGGKPLLAWHLERLQRAGIREVVINVSHLAEQITDRFGDGAGYGLALRWSREAEPLETAGGIAQALPLLGREPFLLVNGDIYCAIDFRPAVEEHQLRFMRARKRECVAHRFSGERRQVGRTKNAFDIDH